MLCMEVGDMFPKKKIADHTTRLLQWIHEYGGWWYLICTPGEEHMNLEMLRLLVKKLHEAELDDLIFVLLTVHREHPALRHIPEYLLLHELSAHWQENREEFLEELVSLLT